jgi:hypothetical protein
MVPLDQVDFSVDAIKRRNDRQRDLFANECQGMCGV